MPRVPRITEVVEAPPTRPALPPTQWPGVVVEPIDGVAPELEGVEAGDEPVEAYLEPTNAEVRAWAAAQDPPVEVSASGPVPKSVRALYDAAHGG